MNNFPSRGSVTQFIPLAPGSDWECEFSGGGGPEFVEQVIGWAVVVTGITHECNTYRCGDTCSDAGYETEIQPVVLIEGRPTVPSDPLNPVLHWEVRRITESSTKEGNQQ